MKEIFVDGGTRFGGICLVDTNSGKTIVKKRNGVQTNNELEYLAIIYGCEYINKWYNNHHSVIYSDSLLIVNQMNDKFRVTTDSLIRLNKTARNKKGKNVRIVWVPREKNLAGIHLEDFY